jgi:glycosyltransferase involved in cell wall biosynthesis
MNQNAAIQNSATLPPRISVVTASWNQGKYLRDCVQSVMNTASDSWEHIVIDNQSDDETPDVLKAFPHLRILVEPDQGQCDAFNKGLALARGEWILWLNADDYMLPGAIDTYLHALHRKQQFDIIYGHMVLVDGGGRTIRTIYQPNWTYAMSCYGVYGLPSTGTLYRADFFRNAPLDVNFHMIMDTEWNLRNGRSIRAVRLRIPTVAFRVSEENKTADNIRTGHVTPRHALEREVLIRDYPFCCPSSPATSKVHIPLHIKLLRCFLRIRVLCDKAFSLCISRCLDSEVCVPKK